MIKKQNKTTAMHKPSVAGKNPNPDNKGKKGAKTGSSQKGGCC